MNAVPHRWVMIALLVASLGGSLFAFALLGRIESGLQGQERERLAAVGRTLSLEIARGLPDPFASTSELRALGAPLDRVRLIGSLDRAFIADLSGVVLVDARPGGIAIRPGFWSVGEQRLASAAWSGDEVFVPATGAGHADGGILFEPVADQSGEVNHVVGLVAGSAFREALTRLSPLILGSRLVAGGLFALIALIVAGSMRRSLREIRRESAGAEPAVLGPDHDAQFVFDTFHGIVSNLKESQTELRTLYTRAEERATTLENVVACMLRSLTTGVLIFDPQRKILLINAAALSILRLPPRSFAGASAEALFHGGEEWLRQVDALFAGEPPPRFEARLTGSAEGESWIGVTSSLIRDPSENVLGGVFLLTDLTETKRLRQRLALKERLAVMGEISSGIAHELRNSLATILGYCRLLERETPAAEAARDYLDKLRSEVRVLEETSEGLLDLVRLGRRHSARVEIDSLLEAALQAVEERSEMSAVAVEKRLGAGAAVDADATALRKAVENVIENGVQAMDRGGTLRVETRVVSRGETSRSQTPNVEELVEIVITDEGPGMRAEVIGQIFTPFFTTKRRGTGLGLSIVQKTIAEHDGTIDVASEPGHGTRFRILLPRLPATSGPAAARADTGARASAPGAAVPAVHAETAQ